jgi:hypothetical protein
MRGDYVQKVGCRERSSVLVGKISSGSSLLERDPVAYWTTCSQREKRKNCRIFLKIKGYLIMDLSMDFMDQRVLF